MCERQNVKVVLWHKRKLGGGEIIFLSLSYGWVVELRLKFTWSMILFRCYKENKTSFNTSLRLIIVIMEVGNNLWEVCYKLQENYRP